MHNNVISLAIGIPALALFAGVLNFDFLPDWLVAQRVRDSKARYYIMSYLALVIIIPVVYVGGAFIRENELGSSLLIMIIAVPLAFLLKFVLIKISKVTFEQ